MNYLDIVVIILLAISFFLGLRTGLVRGIFSLLGIILGLVVAGQFHTAFSQSTAVRVITFIAIFLVAAGVVSLIGLVVRKVVHAVMLGWLDRLGGALLGIVIGSTLVTIALVVYLHFFGTNSVIANSVVFKMLTNKLSWILALLPNKFTEPLKPLFY